MQDLRYAFRKLLKSPGFTIATVVVLALGIGANTAIFSVVSAMLLRPLPFVEPDRLVRLYEGFRDEAGGHAGSYNLSIATLRFWREQTAAVFTDVAAATGQSMTLTGRGRTELLPGARVTANFFPTLGLAPVAGRNFTVDEDVPGKNQVVLISEPLRRRLFADGRSPLGASLRLDGVPHTIIGVMPPQFHHPYRAEIWVPAPALRAWRPGADLMSRADPPTPDRGRRASFTRSPVCGRG